MEILKIMQQGSLKINSCQQFSLKQPFKKMWSSWKRSEESFSEKKPTNCCLLLVAHRNLFLWTPHTLVITQRNQTGTRLGTCSLLTSSQCLKMLCRLLGRLPVTMCENITHLSLEPCVQQYQLDKPSVAIIPGLLLGSQPLPDWIWWRGREFVSGTVRPKSPSLRYRPSRGSYCCCFAG